MTTQHKTLTIAVERLRLATTRFDVQAARRELLAAIVLDDTHRTLALRWLCRQRRSGVVLELDDVANEVLLYLTETPQTALPELGKPLAVHRWRRVMEHMDHWLVNHVSAVQYGDSAGRQFYRCVRRAFGMPLHDSAERPRTLPAPLACNGCEDAKTDARGRCQRCRLRRRE